MTKINGSALTGAAAKEFTRRSLLATAATVGAATALAPLYVRRAFASGGELNILCWADEIPQDIVDDFGSKTGITINKTPFSSNEEQLNKMQATFGEGYDLCMPSFNRASEFQFVEVLQAYDESKLNLGAYQPSILKASADLWTWDGLYHVPHVWGAEALAWKADAGDLSYAESSYGLLWDPAYQGKVQMRAVSGLLGLGLWLDATGKLPSNRMLDTYKSEDQMRKVYDEIVAYAISHKAQLKQFWDSADSIRAGFQENGCVLGLTWDGPAKKLIKEKGDMVFMAPKEGALTWMDGFAMSAAAKNIDEVYAFLTYLQTPEVAGKVAASTSYNATVVGADEFVPEVDRALFQAAYPGDALDRLWWYPAAPAWFNPIRNTYAERWRVS